MSIQQANGQGDLEGVCELENILFDNAFGYGTIDREIRAGYAAVAHVRDPFIPYGVAGYAIVRPGPPLSDLLRLGVHPRMQGKGLGSALLEHVLRLFPGPMMLLVRKNNPAIRIYRKAGFEVTGLTEESWVMRRPSSPEGT